MLEIPACLDAGGNIKSKLKSKGRGEGGTVAAGHHLGLATERKVQPGFGEASTTIVLKCRWWPLQGVAGMVELGEVGSGGTYFGLKEKALC